ADKRVRQALNYAVDKESMVKNLLSTYGMVADGQVVGKDALGFNPTLKAFPYDPDKAKSLLADAGIKNGLELDVVGSPQATYGRSVLEAIGGFFSKVGIKANIKILEQPQYLAALSPGPRPHVLLFALNDPPYDASFAYQRFQSKFAPGSGQW